MSETKHTPGPWQVMYGKHNLTHVETGEGSPIGMGVAVCSVPKAHINDARLIAACPELLEALREMVEVLSFPLQYEARTGRTASDVNDRAVAIIAKAEGRQ